MFFLLVLLFFSFTLSHECQPTQTQKIVYSNFSMLVQLCSQGEVPAILTISPFRKDLNDVIMPIRLVHIDYLDQSLDYMTFSNQSFRFVNPRGFVFDYFMMLYQEDYNDPWSLQFQWMWYGEETLLVQFDFVHIYNGLNPRLMSQGWIGDPRIRVSWSFLDKLFVPLIRSKRDHRMMKGEAQVRMQKEYVITELPMPTFSSMDISLNDAGSSDIVIIVIFGFGFPIVIILSFCCVLGKILSMRVNKGKNGTRRSQTS